MTGIIIKSGRSQKIGQTIKEKNKAGAESKCQMSVEIDRCLVCRIWRMVRITMIVIKM